MKMPLEIDTYDRQGLGRLRCLITIFGISKAQILSRFRIIFCMNGLGEMKNSTKLEMMRLRVRASLASLRCVIEKDTVILA